MYFEGEVAFWGRLQIEAPSVDRQSVSTAAHRMVTITTLVPRTEKKEKTLLKDTTLVPNTKRRQKMQIATLVSKERA